MTIDETDYDTQINGITIHGLEKTKRIYGYTKFIESNHISDTGELSSRSFTYNKLRDFFSIHSEKAIGLGSMSHESKFQFSKKDHDHKGIYSKVEVDPVISQEFTKTVANIDLKNNEQQTIRYQLKVPNKQYNTPQEPYIGTLKFVMIPEINTDGFVHSGDLYNIDIDDPDFDGWVYPNGYEYLISDADKRFEKLKQIGMLQDNKITIPCLCNYLKLNPFKENIDDHVKKVNFKNSIPSHSHDINKLIVSGNASLKDGQSLCENTSDHGKNGTLVHNGDRVVKATQEIPFTINCNEIQFTNLRTVDSKSDLNTESEPNHYMIPIMIYIGGRKKSWYQN